MTKEQLVLARVRVNNGSVSVCADEVLSMQVQEEMLKHNWSMPTETKTEQSMAADQQNVLLTAELEIIAQNKDIMCKIPQQTNFRFLKRILNRVLRLTNRYQQLFNNAVYEAFIGMNRQMNLKLNNEVNHMNNQLRKTETYANEIDDKLVQEIRQSKQLRKQITILQEELRRLTERLNCIECQHQKNS